SIGIKANVIVAGDTRYDRVAEIAKSAKAIPVVERFKGESKLLIAGSTWPKDEKILKEALKGMPPNWKFVIVPHEVNKTHLQKIRKLYEDEAIFYAEI